MEFHIPPCGKRFDILKTLSLFAFIFVTNVSFGQTINAGADQDICDGECADLSATYTGGGVPTDYSVADITYDPDPYGGTTVALTDDSQTGLLPIGFDFCFYGNTYSDFVICSNNWIGFSAGETSTWVTTAIPAVAGAPRNCIMGPWHDINPSVGGTISYDVYGVAPFRRLVVTYETVPMFSCGGMLFTSQIIIYETTNIIENHISSKPICATWNSGNAVQGIHNIDGTAAVVYPGRNNTPWDVTNHAIRYTPTGTPTIEWYEGVTLLGTGADITVCPATTTTYTAKLISCGAEVATDDVVVTVNPDPVIDAGADQEVCDGETVILTGTGAGLGGTYAWDGGVTDGVAFTPPLGTTTYTVTGTDANGCDGTDMVDVIVNPNPVVTATAVPTEVCDGETVVLTGGGADTYTWDGGATDGVAFTPPVGVTTYTVTGTDLTTGCDNTATVDVTVNPLPTVVATADFTEVCEGDFVILSGTGADTYTWDGGVTDGVAFAPPLGTTTYTVTGTNTATGCQNAATIDITVYAIPTVTATAAPDEICLGEAITFTGGGADTYTWTGGVTDGVAFTPPASGTFTYTVTGEMGASGCSNTADVTVTIHDLPAVTATAVPTEICEDETLVLTGGGADTYTWDGGATDGVAFTPPLGVTTFTVTGTDLTTGCENTATIDVTVNPLPVVTASADFTEVCEGDNVILTGGGADTYTWDGGVTDGVAFAPPLGTTTYTVTGTNTATGCQNTATIDITVYAIPTVTATATPDEICIGESITFTGGGADTYTWTGGVTDGVAFTPPASGTFTYTVTGEMGASGCSNTADVTVTIHDLPAVTATAVPTEICEDETLVLTGGGADTYTWDGGATDGVAFTPPLGVTTFTVTGTDLTTGCENTATIDVTVNPLPVVTASADFTEVCEGDNVILTGGGADTYTWDGGVTDGVAFAPPLGTTTYTVTGTNTATGCQNTATIDITVYAIPTVTATATPDEICIGESITFTGGGADTYTWTGGVTDGVAFTPPASGTFTYTVTGEMGASGCINTADVTVTIHDLPVVTATAAPIEICEDETLVLTGGGADTYTWDGGATDGVAFTPPIGVTTFTVTGTDLTTGCENTATVDVTVNALPVVTATADFTEVCIGDNVILSGGGADGYAWDGGVTDGVAFTPPLGTTTYTVIGTDATTGCENTATIDITVFDLPPVTATATPDEVCIGESITFTGGGADTYVWTDGILDGVPFTPPATGTFTYTVTGTLGIGCENTADVTITVHDLPTVTATATPDAICVGETLVLNGGGADTYVWDGGATDGVAFEPPSGTTTYTVTGTDANGCENTASIDVTVNPLPTVTASASEIEICLGESIVMTSGGTAATYDWDGGVTEGAPFTPLTPGDHTFTVTGTSAEGCVSTASVTVTVIECEEVVANFLYDADICIGDCITFRDTSIGTIVSYDWNFEGGTPSTSTVPNPIVCFDTEGTYNVTLTITNEYGLTSSITQPLTVHGVPSINAATDTIIDVGGTAILVATGGDADGAYIWTPDHRLMCDSCQITEARPDQTTTYQVTYYDPYGCSTIDTVLVLVNYSKRIGVPSAFSPNGDGNNDVLFVKGEGIVGMSFQVYNRYGELVFQSDDQRIGWDGTFKGRPENPAVFTWLLHYTFEDGELGLLKGNTTLVR